MLPANTMQILTRLIINNFTSLYNQHTKSGESASDMQY